MSNTTKNALFRESYQQPYSRRLGIEKTAYLELTSDQQSEIESEFGPVEFAGDSNGHSWWFFPLDLAQLFADRMDYAPSN